MDAFDPDKARQLAAHAELPMLYDKMIEKGLSAEQAGDYLRSQVAEGTELKIVSQGGTTAVITNNPETSEINVSYEPHDFWAGVNYYPKEHEGFGGKAYGGYYNAIMDDDKEGFFLDKVKGAVTDFAEGNEGSSSVNLSGFSKAGSMAIGTAAQWISERFPEETGIKIGNIYAYGSPPYGDKEFAVIFEKHADRLGINVLRVDGAGDPVPDVMTEEAKWYAKPFLYAHVGQQVVLPEVQEHSISAYKEGLQKPEAQLNAESNLDINNVRPAVPSPGM